jgi:hypothetical protein
VGLAVHPGVQNGRGFRIDRRPPTHLGVGQGGGGGGGPPAGKTLRYTVRLTYRPVHLRRSPAGRGHRGRGGLRRPQLERGRGRRGGTRWGDGLPGRERERAPRPGRAGGHDRRRRVIRPDGGGGRQRLPPPGRSGRVRRAPCPRRAAAADRRAGVLGAELQRRPDFTPSTPHLRRPRPSASTFAVSGLSNGSAQQFNASTLRPAGRSTRSRGLLGTSGRPPGTSTGTASRTRCW